MCDVTHSYVWIRCDCMTLCIHTYEWVLSHMCDTYGVRYVWYNSIKCMDKMWRHDYVYPHIWMSALKVVWRIRCRAVRAHVTRRGNCNAFRYRSSCKWQFHITISVHTSHDQKIVMCLQKYRAVFAVGAEFVLHQTRWLVSSLLHK